MSETEHIIGRMKPIEIKESLEKTCEEICRDIFDRPIPKYYKDYKEWLEDAGYRDYYFYNDQLYEVIDSTDHGSDSDIYLAREKDDNTIEFELRYYNGDCSFNEALDEAMDDLITKKGK